MSLIHWWPLNGTLEDLGIENTPLVNHGATVLNDGKIGKCYHFDGNNSYLITSNSLDLNNYFLEGGQTISLWIRVDSFSNLSDDYTMILGLIDTDLDYNGIDLEYDGSWYMRVLNEWANVDEYEFSENQWIHLAFVCDETKGKNCLFINGNLVQENLEEDSYSSVNVIGPLAIGGGYDVYESEVINKFKGDICDVRIYNHALSKKEVKELSKGLVLHYNFEDPYVEGTTNLYAYTGDTPKWATNTFYNGATGVYGYGETSNCMYSYVNMPDKNGSMKKMVKINTINDGVTASPYIWINYVNPAVNDYITVSFDYYTTCSTTTIYPYSFRENYKCSYWDENTKSWVGGTTTEVGITIVPNKWNHIVYRFTRVDDSYAGGPGYVRVGTTNSNNVYWLFDNIQVEQKDHATPYVNGTRAQGTIADNSGYNNNGSITGTLQILNDSACGNSSAYFNGSILIKANAMPNELVTACLWYKGTFLTRGVIFADGGSNIACGFYNGNRFIVSSTNENQPVFIPNGYKNDDWNFIAIVRGSSNNSKMYLNGKELSSDGTTNKWTHSGGLWIGGRSAGEANITDGKIADFKIYATALSESDIKAEYNKKASIDKQGNLYTGLFEQGTTNIALPTKTGMVKANHFVEGGNKTSLQESYVELEYIESTGTQYINSNYIPNINTAIEGSFQHTENTVDTPLFGVRTSTSGNSYTFRAHPSEYQSGSGRNTMIFNGASYSFPTGYSKSTIEYFYYSKTTFQCNEQVYHPSPSSGSPNLALIILGLSNGGAVDSRKFIGKLFSFKIYDNGVTVRDFIPAKRKSDNTIGLYDVVNKQFYTNQGTGTFTAGPELNKLNVIFTNELKEI